MAYPETLTTKRGKKFWFGTIGGLIGICLTIWYWSHASRHVPAPEWLSPDKAFSQSDRLDIMEAVFQRMSSESPANAPPAVWFLAVGASNDPPAELLQRLKDLATPVKPLSAASHQGALMLDRETGKAGAALLIKGAQMTGVGEAKVEVSFLPATGPSGSEAAYTVRREGGGWKVAEAKAK